MDLVEPPKKCEPPKYINTDAGPDGKEQMCKEGTSVEAKCRNLGQQRKADEDFPNPSASGGMVQFFKDGFYNAAKK